MIWVYYTLLYIRTSKLKPKLTPPEFVCFSGESKNIVEELTVYCDSERLETKGAKKIGFCL